MTSGDDDDQQPASFQELRKRWAEQELGLKPQEPSPVRPSTSPRPQLQSVASTYSPNTGFGFNSTPLQSRAAPASEPALKPPGPRIPPKPATNPVGSPSVAQPPPPTTSPIAQQQLPNTKNRPAQPVSALAQQFKKQTMLSDSSNIEKLEPTGAASSSIVSQDPFVDDDEAESDSSDSGISLSSSSSSGDSDGDERIVQRVHRREGLSDPLREPPLPPGASKKTGMPPPPPPPSRKYHSAARPAATDIPKASESTAAPPLLPPRPSMHGRPQLDGIPILPPRPSVSTLARSHTIAAAGVNHHLHQNISPPSVDDLGTGSGGGNGGLRRSQSTRATSARKAMQMQQANGIYPDVRQASRKKPYIDNREKRLKVQHNGAIRAVALSRSILATGAHETRIWNTDTYQQLHSIDPSGPNDNSDKVSSLAFAPGRIPNEEGHTLWAGLKDGDILVIQTMSGNIMTRPMSKHDGPVTSIIRYKNLEIWTIDDNGILKIWEPHSVTIKEEHEVTPQSTATLLDGRDLYMANNRKIYVYRFGAHGVPTQSARIPNDLGNITQLATVPYHAGKVFVAHDNGKVSLWDSSNLDRFDVITVSLYGITSMVAVGDHYVWMGYNTGMIYVYDTRPSQWIVVKMWKAHETGIVNLAVDNTGIAVGDNTIQVASMDSHGHVALWDGLLPEYWREQEMDRRRSEYCEERDAKVLICSWNIDANKPEKLSARDDSLVRDWLHGMQDPDIIVVGIQEIVDLESKKLTARSLFASRRKIGTLAEADELLTHRYTLWHDYLVNLINETYRLSKYTVIKTDQLVGLFSCIFVKDSMLAYVSNIESTLVKTGMKVMNKSLHGNKGGIAIRFKLDGSSLCFVNCHLAAGQSHLQQRNADAEGILQTAEFPAGEDHSIFVNGGDGSMIMDHEHCFLSGDLNYRINLTRSKVMELISTPDLKASLLEMQREDQLLKQRQTNPLFKLLLFNESPIDFLPTYKYDPNSTQYDTSEKKRVPAWCDRILYRSRGAECLFYQRHEVLASDHRPISGGFNIRIKHINESSKEVVVHQVESDWRRYRDKWVQDRKVQFVEDYNIFDQHESRQRLIAADWDVERVIEQILGY
ncbi:Endonuclease/exonuclease/phosphatase [Dichotomocladium elegans]|nr:Endonuclease/exonuclease/phosphatase [Dichotomocladium elegans]